MKRIFIVVILVFAFLATGCDTIKTSYEEAKNAVLPKVQEIVIVPEEEPQVCPELPEAQADGIVYYFNSEIKIGLRKFMAASDEYLHCSFPRIDTDFFNAVLIEKRDNIEDVKIVVDQASTFDCTNACVPYSSSQYNALFGEGVDLYRVEDVHGNFCVSEDGIFVTSQNIDSTTRFDFGMYMHSEELGRLYEGQFNEMAAKKK